MTMILIAGLWLDERAWDAVAPTLRERGVDPVALTLPGQNPATTPATLDDQVDAVVAAVDAAEAPVTVVGHSAACTLAWLAADRRPDKVERVVLIGGGPGAEGTPYLDAFQPVDGFVAFPGWEPFSGPDSADLDEPNRRCIETLTVPVAEGVTRGIVHYADERRFDVPVTMVCPEYTPEQAQEWLAAGHLPELERVRQLDYVDLDSGHWPMFSQPDALASLLAGLAC